MLKLKKLGIDNPDEFKKAIEDAIKSITKKEKELDEKRRK